MNRLSLGRVALLIALLVLGGGVVSLAQSDDTRAMRYYPISDSSFGYIPPSNLPSDIQTYTGIQSTPVTDINDQCIRAAPTARAQGGSQSLHGYCIGAGRSMPAPTIPAPTTIPS